MPEALILAGFQENIITKTNPNYLCFVNIKGGTVNFSLIPYYKPYLALYYFYFSHNPLSLFSEFYLSLAFGTKLDETTKKRCSN